MVDFQFVVFLFPLNEKISAANTFEFSSEFAHFLEQIPGTLERLVQFVM